MVILVAVAAGQVAASHRNKMSEHRVARGGQRPAYETKLP